VDPTTEAPTERAESALALRVPYGELPVRIRHSALLDDAALFRFCAANRDLRIERAANGEILIMPPTGGETGRRNLGIATQLGVWAERDGTGIGFDSSTGFVLPNGAERSPDAAWVTRERWNALTETQRNGFPPLCPDFVVELQSPSDALADLKEKLEEYIACGARLGWLLEPARSAVHVYRPGEGPLLLTGAASVSADPILRGFTLDLSRIW
jgi:Uma2 family endonuclease